MFNEISDTNIGILRNKITVYIEEYKRLVDVILISYFLWTFSKNPRIKP